MQLLFFKSLILRGVLFQFLFVWPQISQGEKKRTKCDIWQLFDLELGLVLSEGGIKTVKEAQ